MSYLKRTVAAVGVPALLALSLSACGSSSSSAPSNASVKDFCSAFNATDTSSSSDFKDEIKKIKDTGTPSNMPSDARKGFEVVLDKADSASSEKALDNLDPSDFSSTEQTEIEAFAKYIAANCTADLGSTTESDVPTALPS